MNRDTLTHLPVVAAVARHRSFAAVAAEMGLSASAVSHAVRVVEGQLGTALFRRTTRSVSLTETGEAFLRRATAALTALEEAVAETQALRGLVTGVLRINAPRVSLPMVMTDLVAELSRRHPELVVEVTSEDALVDIVAEGYDAGVRLGEMIREDMIAVRLTPPFHAVMVASPDYLTRAGEPLTLTDLQAHNTIGYRQASTGGIYAWDVVDAGKPIAIEVRGTARVTDPLFALELALSHVGIAYLFEPLVRSHIRAGRLRWILPDAALAEPGLFLYFPRHVADAPKLRAFIQAAKERLAAVAG
jgi:DNA-binding transcriptional LysR family regulator